MKDSIDINKITKDCYINLCTEFNIAVRDSTEISKVEIHSPLTHSQVDIRNLFKEDLTLKFSINISLERLIEIVNNELNKYPNKDDALLILSRLLCEKLDNMNKYTDDNNFYEKVIIKDTIMKLINKLKSKDITEITEQCQKIGFEKS